jgi:uncharacterized UPF0146 family protein
VPGYIQNLPKLREKGVDIVAVVAFNDPFVMSAWGKANRVQRDDIVRPHSDVSRIHLLILMNSCFSLTPTPSFQRALAGLMRHPVVQADMPSSSIMVRSDMPRLKPKEVRSG